MERAFKEKVFVKLVEGWDYEDNRAKSVVEELSQCAPEILAAFRHWWETGKLGDLEVEGYTVSKLMEQYGMNPFAAFLTLDWLWKEPKVASQAIAQGYDYVDTSSLTEQD